MKRVREKIGLSLIALGLSLIIVQPINVITGRVIAQGSLDAIVGVPLFFFIALGMFVFGVFMVAPDYKVRRLEDIMNSDGGSENTIYVLDSSGAIDYKHKIGKLLNQYDGKVYVPKRIKSELKNDRILSDNFNRPNIKSIDSKTLGESENVTSDEYRELRRMATKALGKSDKHKAYIHLTSILKENPKVDYSSLDYRDQKALYKLDKEIGSKKMNITNKDRINYMKKRWRVSKGDVDVLTNALVNAEHGNNTKILATDSHIKDAVKILKIGQPDLKRRLNYIAYRDYSGKEYSRAA